MRPILLFAFAFVAPHAVIVEGFAGGGSFSLSELPEEVRRRLYVCFFSLVLLLQ